MNQIVDQVRCARRRLSIELFVNRLFACWLAAMLAVLVAIAVPKLVAIENLPEQWLWTCLGIGIVAGMAAAFLWTVLRGRSELDAAVEIDRRFGLRERVASSLSMTDHDAKTPAGQALLSDTLRAVGRIDVGERFRLQLDRHAWLPLVPALFAFALASFVENRETQSSIDSQVQQAADEQNANAFQSLREKLLAKREQADSKKLKDAEGLFRELEKQAQEMAEATDTDKKRSLVKLNELKKQLEERRQRLGGDQQLRQQLAKMKNFERGPGDQVLDKMKQGDWSGAMQELAKLKEQLASSQLDEKAKQKLAKQLQQLGQRLAKSTQARQQAMENLKKQIERQKQQGNLARAGELQQQLEQMQKQNASLDKMNQLAQKMAEAQQAMQQGDMQAAAEALEQMMGEMDQLAAEMAEGELLEGALEQLQMAKDALDCKQCLGQGCQTCRGAGNRFSQKPGNGMGPGRGMGPRPDEKNDVNFRDSRVRQDPRGGAAVIVGEAHGGNFPGTVSESVKEQMTAQQGQPADPLVTQQMPKSYREHAEEYFNRIREGQ